MRKKLDDKNSLKDKKENEQEEAEKNDRDDKPAVNKNSSKNIPDYTGKIDYEKLSKDDLITKIKEFEDKFKMELEERKKLLNTKKNQIDEKDKIIESFSKANKKLINELETIKREVDQRLDKVNIKAVQKIEKINEEKKNNPLEIVLKVKERELKNTFQMMEIVKRDKDILQRQLDEKSDYKRIVGLEDNLLNEEKKNQNLQMEIKVLQKMLDEHNKKCLVRVNQNAEKEKATRDEIKILKDKNRDYGQKLKEEEEKHNETKNKYQELRRDYDKIKNFAPEKVEEKEKEKEREKERTHKLTKSVTIPNNSLKKDKDGKDQKDSDSAGKRSNSQERSPSKSTQNKRKKLYPEEKKLFSTTDLKKLSKLLTKAELEKYEKKFDFADHKSLSLERKYNSELKVYTKKYHEIEEQLEFVTLQLKEAEQRAKIFQFQIHEHKIETKSLSKRCLELQGNIDVLQKLVVEKENENKTLINRIQESHSLNDMYKKKNLEMETILKEYRRKELEEHSNNHHEGHDEDEEGEEGEDGQHENIKPQRNKNLDDDDL